MKAMICTLALFLGFVLLSGCASNAADSGHSGSKVQIYGTVDSGIGYQSKSISHD